MGSPTDGAAVGTAGASSAPVGETADESGTDDATTVTGLWFGAVAPRCLGRAGDHPVAARVDDQYALQPHSPAGNPASAELLRTLS